MRYLLLIVLLLGAGCEDKMVRHDRPIVKEIASLEHKCDTNQVKVTRSVHFGGGSTRFELDVCGTRRSYECGEWDEGGPRTCRERSRPSPEPPDACQVLRVERDRLRRVVAKLRAQRRPLKGTPAGIQAVVDSVGRLLVQYGVKGASLDRIKHVLTLTGIEAELKEYLRREAELKARLKR